MKRRLKISERFGQLWYFTMELLQLRLKYFKRTLMRFIEKIIFHDDRKRYERSIHTGNIRLVTHVV